MDNLGNYEEVLTASNVNGDITIESHHINITNLMAEFSTKKNKYMSTYGTRPQYIKLPIWIYRWLCHSATCYVYRPPETKEVFFRGLLCCPTPSISELEEIELF